MTGENVNPIPNALTVIRLIGGAVMFILLAGAVGGIPFLNVTPETLYALQRWGVYTYMLAAITDLLDGWLARKLHAESRWGAILDPIADKILVCGTILGLFCIKTGDPVFALPAALILFREFAVSALRETAAAKGVQVPVSFMGKIKTTLQLVALGALLVTESWSAFDLPPDFYDDAFVVSNLALLIAAIVSLWSGLAYFFAARKSL
ncbi:MULTISPECIES: CDP-diacylglycerol--glycerol-3-phosphate 3-phosphatidyltransferase [Asticcacaulis]|uniref:CDP-diacylglycerol--glycerol-3-phosphate 3-phosphatidyltransferase n=1 Tax=Asticcacaulis TaxID=76890 RepID=UPI001AE7F584|nr:MULTISPECIES: CDP-diacylglycerol--glycerol-3-phosphate 3-phosphatidyltransferase [Asticcacaulis]MBP2160917.1 CDP-diacylglycerol--glycerol-3-phosphate 3-phosphatidyltransferase [Asticcacaulis solisilvae]MDR6801879.1 CDP-diacylglycerol--glycerol-3-phosphate 3-phosphatidyltransferase [Asticcacaulis sp. BE141]